MSKNLTVVEYVIRRLADLGIDRAFGVPGDYSFPIDDAIEFSSLMKWVVCANELNAAYAADGYARRRGAALLTTTYAVGELSAVNGVMGAKAHRVPIFHVVGAPSTRIQRAGMITHHTLGDGVYGNFFDISAACCGVSAKITPDNVITEMERVIHEAFRLSQPAYIQIPEDYAVMPVQGIPVKGKRLPHVFRGKSNPLEVKAAVRAILARLKKAKRPIAMPSFQVKRYHAQPQLLSLLKRTGLPFTLTSMDKGVVDESHPNYLGLFAGKDSAPASAGKAALSADLILCVGEVLEEDFNVGSWSALLDPARKVILGPDYVKVGDQYFTSCMLPDVLAELARYAPRVKKAKHPAPKLLPLVGHSHDPISSAALYPRLQRFLQDGDNLVVEGGSCMFPCASLLLPKGVSYEGQILWASIGWATPTTLGVALAEPKRRTVMVSGDGAHQLTANEIGVMGRYGINPILIVLNNGIYGVEDVLSERGHVYDDLAGWNYHTLPAAMGCRDWFCTRIETVGDLESALVEARNHSGACYLEVMIPETESQPLSKKIINRIYKAYPN
jgi:indolepyruvate decarboxylase